MITAVIAVPQVAISNMVDNPPGLVIWQGLPWHLISIHCHGRRFSQQEFKKLELEYGVQSHMSLVFGDVTNEQDAHLWDSPLFTAEQAKRVVRHLQVIHRRESSEMLVVQCFAGISRSGAIATFASDLYQLSYDKFKVDNPHVQPNSYVLALLNRVRREMET